MSKAPTVSHLLQRAARSLAASSASVWYSIRPNHPGGFLETHVEYRFDGDPFVFVHVFRATDFSGWPEESPEARPKWFHVEAVPDEMWPHDRYWLPELFDGETFAGTMYFDEDGDELLDYDLAFGVAVE